MINESKMFFDHFSTGVKLSKGANQTDALNTLYDRLVSEEYTLIRVVKADVAELVYSFLHTLFPYSSKYKGVGLGVVRYSGICLIIYKHGGLPGETHENLDSIREHTIREIDKNGFVRESTFHNYL